MPLFTLTIILFLTMDPFGNIATYLKLLELIPPSRKRWYVVREMGIALFVMVIFHFLSDFLFWFLQISEVNVRLTSGLILFLFAIKILFSSPTSPRKQLPPSGEEPFIIPLAIPLIAGPALLATILLFSRLEPRTGLMLLAIFIAWLASVIVLALGPLLNRLLGKNGLLAFEKLMGMVLILLAIQRLLDGIRAFISTYGTAT